MKNTSLILSGHPLRMKSNHDSNNLDASHRLAGVFGTAIVAGALLLAVGTVSAGDFRLNRDFNRDGNVLISDQFNNRVIETDTSGHVIWSYGLGPNDFSSNTIIGVNDAQRVGDYTLMAGTGTPPGVIPQATNGGLTIASSWLIPSAKSPGNTVSSDKAATAPTC